MADDDGHFPSASRTGAADDVGMAAAAAGRAVPAATALAVNAMKPRRVLMASPLRTTVCRPVPRTGAPLSPRPVP